MGKTIFLKKISLKNFKGIRNLSIDFKDKETVIAGANATGKTTVFDSFMWLLFGKDSGGNSEQKFNIKTLDNDGKPILKLEHEVSVILDISGKIVELKRVYLEKWEKPRGSNEETLKNHYTEFYINGVKQATKRDYDAYVSSIIQEDVFKMITNPFYFNSLPATAQKEMLLDMAGNVTDDEIAKQKPEFVALLAQLTGKSLETFLKEINAKKRAVKDEIEQIPARIDTAQKLKPDNEDWGKIETKIENLKKDVSDVENQLADKTKQIESEYNRKAEIRKQIGEKQVERAKLENEIKLKLQSNKNSDANILSEKKNELEKTNRELTIATDELTSLNAVIVQIDNELDELRNAYKAINNEQLTYPDGAFICPTCLRPLDIEDVEKKQADLQANFNDNKANKLKENQSLGKAKAAKKERMMSDKKELQDKIETLKNSTSDLIATITDLEANKPKDDVLDVDAMIKQDPKWIDLGNEISELENQLNVEAAPVDTSVLKEKKLSLQDEISTLVKRLSNREAIERADNLIKQYEKSRTENNQALADLEKMEFTAIDFQKAKDNELMNRINGMFEYVRFTFIDEQLNGGEKITCNCLVNTNGSWVPFATDANRAGTINAGLDIINAICKSKGVTAPIFIDNRESVNQLIPTNSQIINLYVSNHPKLSIRTSAEGEIEMFTEL